MYVSFLSHLCFTGQFVCSRAHLQAYLSQFVFKPNWFYPTAQWLPTLLTTYLLGEGFSNRALQVKFRGFEGRSALEHILNSGNKCHAARCRCDPKGHTGEPELPLSHWNRVGAASRYD